MTTEQYVILAYALGLLLMWGYVMRLWFRRRALRRGGSATTTG